MLSSAIDSESEGWIVSSVAQRIVRSIWITTVLLLVIQGAIAAAVSWSFRLGSPPAWYPILLLSVHAVMAPVLARLGYLFVTVPGNEQLDHVNTANLLSMIRLSAAPTLLWMILSAAQNEILVVLVPFAAGVFLTDLLDGQVSRRTGTITRIGRFLDSSSDYALLIVVSIALGAYTMLSRWFFLAVGLRFGLQIVGQVVLFVIRSGQITFRSSFLGKASVFLVMILYAGSLFAISPFAPSWVDTAVSSAEYLVGAILMLSLAEKIYLFVTDVRLASDG